MPTPAAAALRFARPAGNSVSSGGSGSGASSAAGFYAGAQAAQLAGKPDDPFALHRPMIRHRQTGSTGSDSASDRSANVGGGLTLHRGGGAGGGKAANNAPALVLRRPGSGGGGGGNAPAPAARRTSSISGSVSDPNLTSSSRGLVLGSGGGEDGAAGGASPAIQSQRLRLSTSREKLRELMGESVIDWEKVRHAQVDHYRNYHEYHRRRDEAAEAAAAAAAAFALGTGCGSPAGDGGEAGGPNGGDAGAGAASGIAGGAGMGGHTRRRRTSLKRRAGSHTGSMMRDSALRAAGLAGSMERFERALFEEVRGRGAAEAGSGALEGAPAPPAQNASWECASAPPPPNAAIDNHAAEAQVRNFTQTANTNLPFAASYSSSSALVDWEKIRKAQESKFNERQMRLNCISNSAAANAGLNRTKMGTLRKARSYHGRASPLGCGGLRRGLARSMERFEQALLEDQEYSSFGGDSFDIDGSNAGGRRQRRRRSHQKNEEWDHIGELISIPSAAGASPLYESGASSAGGGDISRSASPAYHAHESATGGGLDHAASALHVGGGSSSLASGGNVPTPPTVRQRKYITAPTLEEMGILPPTASPSPTGSGPAAAATAAGL